MKGSSVGLFFDIDKPKWGLSTRGYEKVSFMAARNNIGAPTETVPYVQLIQLRNFLSSAVEKRESDFSFGSGGDDAFSLDGKRLDACDSTSAPF